MGSVKPSRLIMTTDTIEINTTVDVAERLVDQMDDELDRMENVLNSFRSNGLSDTQAYDVLQDEMSMLVEEKGEIRGQIQEAQSDNEDEGLGELFG